MSQHITPRVFVSAVSSDLGSARKMVNDALTRIECLPIEESVFGTEYGPIRDMLQRKIADCQAVIHLVGRGYGGEPDPQTLPTGQPRRSWTQIEYDLAKELGKKLYIIVCDDVFPFDALPSPEPDEKTSLQAKHRQAVLDDQHLWHTVRDADQLRAQVENLKVPLDEVRSELVTVAGKVEKTGRRLGRWVIGVAALVLLSIGIGGFVVWQQNLEKDEIARLKKLAEEEATQRAADKKLQQQFAERFLEKLIRGKNLPVEVARKQALADLPELTRLSADAIRQIIDGRITELTKDAGATPLDRARAKLTIADYDGVLAEAAKQRTDSRELEMLAGAAALARFRQQPRPEWNEKAAAAFHRALALSDAKTEPLAWADAADWTAFVLHDLGRYSAAEPLLRKALKLREARLGPDDPEVANCLNNLALLLQATNRLAPAEPLMRRALAIDEQSYGAEHPYVAIHLNSLAQLLQATNRLAEAEPLMRRPLAIDEQSYGADHPHVAIDLNNLAQLLQDTNRLAEAEPLMRRALAVDEQFYGAEHPDVARDLNNLAALLHATNRLAEAEPLMRRMVAILDRFHKATGHEHPHMQADLENLRLLLAAMELPPDEIERRVQAAIETAGKLKPIAPEVEQLLGPAKPVAEVLEALDRQYKAEGKPAVYFLTLDKPIAPHLDELFEPNANSLSAMGVAAYLNSDFADAVVLDEESLKLYARDAEKTQQVFETRINRADARQQLGDAEQARQELRRLLPELEQDASTPAFTKGLARFHLALCEWRLGDRASAQREAEKSLQAYSQAPDENPVPEVFKKEAGQLLADIKETKPLPPRPKIDVAAELQKARDRFRARQNFARLPLDQPAAGLLNQMLNPAKPVADVLAELDRQYKADGKPAVYSLTSDHLIARHLDKLLGPAKSTKDVFDALDRQYREQGKPAVWFLPLDKPIVPHLDELLGPLPEGATNNIPPTSKPGKQKGSGNR